MAAPAILPAGFGGMFQDEPRDRLPKGKSWNLVDYIPNILGAPIAQRGGWGYASAPLTDYDPSATYAASGFFADFTSGPQLLAIDSLGHLIKVTSTSSGVDMGAAQIPRQLPMLFNNLVVIPSDNGIGQPLSYDGVSAPLGINGSPLGQFGCVYGDRVWLGNVGGEPQRLFASAPSDPLTWDLTDSWFDVNAPITGVAALPTVMLVFMSDHTARFRGTQPPPQTDMSKDEPIFQYGCTDARSIAVNGSYAVFANDEGVFLTNGTAFPTDITLAVGLKQYWLALMEGYDSSSWVIVSGWYGNYIVLTVSRGPTFLDGFIFDIRSSAGWRISNLDAAMMFPSVGVQQELYAASHSSARILSLSSMFSTPGDAFAADADGTPVTPVWETPFFDLSKTFGSQRWRDVYLEYDLRDPGGFDPTFTIEACFSPEAGAAYTTLAPALGATTSKRPMRRPVRQASWGAGFRITRQNAASDARIYNILATAYPREGSRVS